jgi:hypothetical protein
MASFARFPAHGVFLLSVLALVNGGCGSSSSSTMSGTSPNLILNGNAEAAAGGTDGTPVKAPDWTSSGGAGALQYGSAGIGYPIPGAPDAGKSFFSGGPDDATSSLTQTIDVSEYATAIDAGGVTYTLEGYLGGFSDQADYASLTATFKDASGAPLGKGATIGPVTAADRKNVTELLKRSSTGAVPEKTSSVVVVLEMTRDCGAYNDGYANDLSLVFMGPGI